MDRSKHPRRRRLWALISSTAILLTVLGAGAWNALRPLPAVTVHLQAVPSNSAANLSPLGWPATGSAAAGVVGFGMVAVDGTQTPRPTASVAKAITSLAVLEKNPLNVGEQGAAYTVTPSDVASYNHYIAIGGSVAAVSVGEQLTEYQALQALMLPSANNVADSLAIWTFGSLEAYKAYATDMVHRLGMTNTAIGDDASGLSPTTTSTPSDLVKLGLAVMDNPVLAEIVGQSTAEIPVAGTIKNVDWLLGQEGVVGIKTGNTEEAGGCFLGAATHTLADGTKATIITAIMGATTRNTAMADTLPLLRSIKANVSRPTLVQAGQTFGLYNTPWGGASKVVAKKSVTFTRWNGYEVTVNAHANTLTGPAPKGTIVGTLTARSGDQTASTDLVLAQDIAAPSLWWRATRH